MGALVLLSRWFGAEERPFAETLILSSGLGLVIASWQFILIGAVINAGSAWFLAPMLACDMLLALPALHALRSGAPLPRALVLLLIAMATLGTWAYLAFPHSFDNPQLMHAQKMLRPELPVGLGKSFGELAFTSVIYPLGLILKDFPLTILTAAMKPLLFALAGLTAWAAASRANLTPVWFHACALAALMYVTDFGSFGMSETGKPSAYGALFAVMLMVVHTFPEQRKGDDLSIGILFGAATVGIINVPYLGTFLAIAFIASRDRAAFLRDMRFVLLFGALPTAYALHHASHIGWGLAAGGIAVAAIVTELTRRGILLWRDHWVARPPSDKLGAALAALPATLMIATALLFPVRYESQIGILRRPTDGHTSFIEFLTLGHLGKTSSNFIIFTGLAACCLLPILVRDRRQIVAFCAWPFAVWTIVLTFLHLEIVIRPGNNQGWDLVKDVLQWFQGPFFGLAALLLFRLTPWRPVSMMLTASLVAIGLWQFQKPLIPPVAYFTDVSGHREADVALTAREAWRHPDRRFFFLNGGHSASETTLWHGAKGHVIDGQAGADVVAWVATAGLRPGDYVHGLPADLAILRAWLRQNGLNTVPAFSSASERQVLLVTQ